MTRRGPSPPARRGLWLVWVLVLTALVGCSTAERPDLLTIVEAAPRELEVGDRLELLGDGFPEGKVASVTWSGMLHRAGAEATPVELTTRATASSRNHIVVSLSSELVRDLCGRGASARHTTFRGKLRAAFAPRSNGAAPVTGTLDGVVVDLFPADVPQAVHRQRVDEGKQALAYLGIVATPTRPGPITIDQVNPDGRAGRAGLQSGDKLVEVGGVRTQSLADVVPSGRHRMADLVVRRGRKETSLVFPVDVQGFRNVPPDDLVWAMALVALAALLVAGRFFAPGARVLDWLQRRVAGRLRAADKSGSRSLVGWFGFGLEQALGEAIVPGKRGEMLAIRLVPYFLFLVVSAAFTVLCFGHTLLEPELDLGLLFIGSATALVTCGLMLGGVTGPGRWSLLRGLGQAGLLLSWELPALGALLSVVLTAGSVRLADIVHAQGGAPWQWHVFSSPLLFLQFALFLSPALVEMSRVGSELPEADVEASRPSHGRTSRYVMFFAEWGHVFVVSGLASAVFLGGWRIPGLAPRSELLHPGWAALGAGLFLLKSWLLSAAVLWLRWVLPRVRMAQLFGLCWKWCVPLSALGLVASLGWLVGLRSALFQAVETSLRFSLFGFALILLVGFARRVGGHLRERSGPVGVNPWL